MEQRPIDGAAPLNPPDSETAHAYLDELNRVRARREERIDRHALAVFALINAVVLSVYVTIAIFTIGVTQANSSFLVFLALFLLWVQLGTEYREGHGASSSSLSSSRAVTLSIVAVLIIVVVGGLVVAVVGVELPVVARLIPGIVALCLMGIPAVRDIRRSVRREAAARRGLTRSERWETIVIGAIVAASVWVLAIGNPFAVLGFAMLLMCGYLAWWVAGRITERLPVVGAVWAWPQWLAFALGGVAVVAVIVAQLIDLTAAGVAPAGAVIILLLFIGSAFLDGRDG
ncbi:hypothetical protein [Microbacterium sp. A84]|uniref:hypothetical protein n=1 Tax=Microbacterium sp. A84 TaxID=3450715 RepID=UPI003F433CA5